MLIKLEKTLIKGNELNQRVAKLEKKVTDVEQQLERRGKEVEQFIAEIKQKTRLPEIVIMKNIYRISLSNLLLTRNIKIWEGLTNIL